MDDSDIAKDFVNSIQEHMHDGQESSTSLVVPKTPDEVRQSVTDNISKVIQQGVDAITELKDRSVACGDPDTVESLASLISSTVGAIETLSRLQSQERKERHDHALTDKRHQNKLVEIDHKTQSFAKLGNGPPQGIIIATREDIMRALQNSQDKVAVPAITAEAEVVPDEEEVSSD